MAEIVRKTHTTLQTQPQRRLPVSSPSYEYRPFLHAGCKNLLINRAHNDNPPKYRHVTTDFVLEDFCARAGIKKKSLIVVLGFYVERHQKGLIPRSKISVAKEIGISTSTLYWAEIELRDKGLLDHRKDYPSDYFHKDRKAFRWIYQPSAYLAKIIKKTKIESLKNKSKIYSQDHTHGRENLPLRKQFSQTQSMDVSIFSPIWEVYVKHFTKSEKESLRSTLWHMAKWEINVPKPERWLEAMEIAIKNPWIKEAHVNGYRGASKGALLSKEGVVNDNSSYWGKYSQGRIGLLWIGRHAEDIIAGKYKPRPLSEKSSGRAWAKKQERRMADGDYRAEAIPESFGQEYIAGLPCCSRERAIRGQLLGDYGILRYEHWFDKASMDMKADGTWALQVKDAWTAKQIGGKFPRLMAEVVPHYRIRKPGKGLRQSYTQHLASLEATANGSLEGSEYTLAQGPTKAQAEGDLVQDVAVTVTGSAGSEQRQDMATDVTEGLTATKTTEIDPEAPNDEIISNSLCGEEKTTRSYLLGKYGGFVYERWIKGCGYDPERQSLTHESGFHRKHISDKYGVSVLVPVANNDKNTTQQSTPVEDKTLDDFWSDLRSAIKGRNEISPI